MENFEYARRFLKVATWENTHLSRFIKTWKIWHSEKTKSKTFNATTNLSTKNRAGQSKFLWKNIFIVWLWLQFSICFSLFNVNSLHESHMVIIRQSKLHQNHFSIIFYFRKWFTVPPFFMILFKGATKLYSTHHSCMVIILFNICL